jgi:hypothetical protein
MPDDSSKSFRVYVDAPGSSDLNELPPNPADTFAAQAGWWKAIFHKEEKDFDFDKLNAEWQQKIEQINQLGKTADESHNPGGFKLTEIDLGLTLTAEGHFAFVASASASATISLKFTR